LKLKEKTLQHQILFIYSTEVTLLFIYSTEVTLLFIYSTEVTLLFIYSTEITLLFIYYTEVTLLFIYCIEVTLLFIYSTEVALFSNPIRGHIDEFVTYEVSLSFPITVEYWPVYSQPFMNSHCHFLIIAERSRMGKCVNVFGRCIEH